MPEERAPWGAPGRELLTKGPVVSTKEDMDLLFLFNGFVRGVSLSVEIKGQKTPQKDQNRVKN